MLFVYDISYCLNAAKIVKACRVDRRKLKFSSSRLGTCYNGDKDASS